MSNNTWKNVLSLNIIIVLYCAQEEALLLSQQDTPNEIP